MGKNIRLLIQRFDLSLQQICNFSITLQGRAQWQFAKFASTAHWLVKKRVNSRPLGRDLIKIVVRNFFQKRPIQFQQISGCQILRIL
jgi:hypothetical protein